MLLKKCLCCIGLLLSFSFAFAQKKYTTVFAGGNDGYKNFRIPALVSLPNGDLLAFCEGRVNNAGDFGNIDIVMKKSNDHGKTWSALQVVVDVDHLQAGNPAPVVDLADPNYPGGRIFLFYNTGNNHEGEVRKGHGLREVWYVCSTDGGNSWDKPVNITQQVHHPNNSRYQDSLDWRSYANSPGHALQFKSGTYAGRIYVSANHSRGNPQPHFKDYQAHGYYTDDHGKTFHLSENVPYAGGNESMSAVLSDGKLMMNARNQQGNERARIIAISKDGGAHWDTTYIDHQLPDPVCQGSILSSGAKLLFCNNASTTRRDNLTLYVSRDDGKSYGKKYVIAKSPDAESKGSYSAYSDIAFINKKTVGILFEIDDYKRIVFAVQKF